MRTPLFKRLIIIPLTLLWSCYDPSGNMSMDPDFVSVEQLLDAQLVKLNDKKVRKSVRWNDESSEMLITVDSTILRDELSKFYELQISADALRGGYVKKSNGDKTTFTRKPSEQRGPQYVIFEKTDNGLNIIGHLMDKTFLYSKGTLLNIAFDKHGRLTNYAIKGIQKLALSDSVGYEINGELVN